MKYADFDLYAVWASQCSVFRHDSLSLVLPCGQWRPVRDWKQECFMHKNYEKFDECQDNVTACQQTHGEANDCPFHP